MNMQKAEQAIVNAIYAAVAWLLLDLGLLFQAHGSQTPVVLLASPMLALGMLVVIGCIIGLIYKSRVAAILLFLFFLLPQVLRMLQGSIPSDMMLIFFLVLLYFFLTGIFGIFRYHHLSKRDQEQGLD